MAPHPDFPCEAVEEIAVDVTRTAGGLSLRYVATGDMSRVRLLQPGPRGRADELWKYSCFEAFIQADDGYREINLSPSGQWAAYRFDGYRQGMAPADAVIVGFDQTRAETHYDLTANLDLTGMNLPDGAWSLALSAVIELTDGRRGFWALSHPPGKPDFHHPDSFTLSLDPP